MSKRVRSGEKAGSSKSKSGPSILTPQSTLFSQTLLLEGEDAAAYDQLLESIRAAVKPLDILDDILIADIAMLQWEILRWRRLKSRLIATLGISFLKSFLLENVDYDDLLAQNIKELLEKGLPEDEKGSAETLAQRYIEADDETIEKVTKTLDGMGYNRAEVEENAKADVVNEIMQAYLQREPHAIKVVHEFFTEAGEDMDSFMASALVQNLDSVERIDRITTMAERRRDNALHEIERRRTALGEALRGAVQEIEDGEFRAIGSIPDNEKNAA